jgi:hypothetical protein
MIREEQEKNDEAKKAIQDEVEMDHMPQLKGVYDIVRLDGLSSEMQLLDCGRVGLYTPTFEF